jgi:hypothetical protein
MNTFWKTLKSFGRPEDDIWRKGPHLRTERMTIHPQ